MSQGELAVAIGVSLRTVQNYEKSGMHPKQRDLYYRLAEVLNVEMCIRDSKKGKNMIR